MEKWEKLAIGTAVAASLIIPIFRSGGRTHLTFWQWVWNHTIFGPPIEYVPEESYRRELEGVEIPKQLPVAMASLGWVQLDRRTVVLSPQVPPSEWSRLDTRIVTIYPEEEIPPGIWTKLDTRTITITPEEAPPPPPGEWTKLDTRTITLTPTEVPPIPPPEEKPFPTWGIILIGGLLVGGLAIAATAKS